MEENSPTKLPVVALSRCPIDNMKPTLTPLTPVKKRAGRLAAEPQLDLIEENATVNSPRSKRRSVDERPLTPARRSTRIRSNTSLVSETPQIYESPRAKRAARRSSIAGSDTESNVSITSTRRSRRNSKTEETQVDISGKPAKDFEVIDVIIEESDPQKSPKASQQSPTTTTRRSPRLADKEKTDEENNSLVAQKKPNVDDNSVSKLKNQPSRHDDNGREDSEKNEETEIKVEDKDRLTIDQIISLAKEDFNKMENKTKTYLNKSLSALDHNKTNRSRTKSWTGMMCNTENVKFLSDNESVKKNVKKGKKNKINNTLEENSSNTFSNKKCNSSELFGNSCKEAKLSTPTKNTILTDKSHDETNANMNFESSIKEKEEDPLTNIQSSISSKQDCGQVNSKSDETSKLFPVNRVYDVKVAVVIEKPDSNIDSNCEGKTNYQMNNEDQCVPVVHKNSSLSPTRNNDTCEPMDIDESIPNNTSLLENFTNKSFTDSTRKDNIYGINESSLTYTPRKHPEQGCNNSVTNTNKSLTQQEYAEKNKSTVNLSQMNENDNVEFLQKSINVPDSTEDKENMKSLTPLKNKMSQKFGLQTSTPVVSEIEVNAKKPETKKKNIKSKNKKNMKGLEQDGSDTDEESEKYQNSLIDDEAKETSENYESGDSLDDEDRIYQEENEIIEKGETLTSEDFSNDSDYEKDSFVVSSDDDHNELLSGTGDDLSMNDEELTMSAKSKKKFNVRKLKEQKRASREMYESRHKLNDSNESNKQKKNKRRRLETENDENIKPIKGNRLRLESSTDAIDDVSKKMKPRKLSESFVESVPIEKEITHVFSESIVNTVDPLSLDNTKHTCIEKMETEEIEIEMNKSIVVKNESVDSLQAAVDASDDSMSSENEEIKQNYDAMLSELNTHNQKKPSHNISLNLNKKNKNKNIDPIIDQLNLTGTRKRNKSGDKDESISKEKASHKDDTNNKQDSSDSIDLQLLFSDSSNDSNGKDIKTDKTDSVDFIPLRSSVSKTDVRKESEITIDTKELSLNKSGRKSEMKQNQSAIMETFTCALDEDFDSSPVEVSFKGDKKRQSIVDGTETAVSSIEELSVNISKKLNKKTSSESPVSLNFLGFPSTELDNLSMDNSSVKDKSKNTSVSREEIVTDSKHDTSLGASKKKKKNSISVLDKDLTPNISPYSTDTTKKVDKWLNNESKLDTSIISSKREEIVDASEATVAESYSDTSQSTSKKKKKKSESSVDDATVTESYFDISQGNPKKKKKNFESSIDDATVAESYFDRSQSISKKKKKKSDSSLDNATVAESYLDISQGNSMKKKRKSELSVDDATVAESYLDISQGNSKKKKKNSESSIDDVTVTESYFDIDKSSSKKKSESVDNATVAESYFDNSQGNSIKKKKKSELSVDDANVAESYFDISQGHSKKKKKNSKSSIDEATVTESYFDISQSSSKKKKKKFESSLDDATVAESYFDISESISKKKKKKSESTVYDDNIPGINQNDLVESPEKKRKKSVSSVGEVLNENECLVKLKKKKSKISSEQPTQDSDNIVSESITADINSDVSKKHKKKFKIQALDDRIKKLLIEDLLQEAGPSNINEFSETKHRKKHKNTRIEDSVGIEEPKQTYEKTQNEDNLQMEASSGTKIKKSKKRKQRDDDFDNIKSKISKTTELPQLSLATLDQLKKRTERKATTSEAVSTTKFIVEETRKRKRFNPSNYLEESVCLNVSPVKKKLKSQIMKPKVLPFLPTASTSDSGFTTRFSVNVMPKQIEFVMQSSDIINFKRDTLLKRKRVTNKSSRIHLNHNLSKF